jgi:hypothetical protein
MQQINFYLPEFQPNREPFRSSQLAIGLLLLILVLAGATLNSHLSNKKLEQELVSQTDHVQGLRDQLQQFATLSSKVDLIQLDNQIVHYKTAISRKQQLLQVIAYQRLGNNKGFSAELETMARQSSDDIALTMFSLINGGTYLEMIGQSTSADKLPAYIQALKSEASFNDVSFGVVAITPAKHQIGIYSFVVAQAGDEALESVSAVQRKIKDNQQARAIP